MFFFAVGFAVLFLFLNDAFEAVQPVFRNEKKAHFKFYWVFLRVTSYHAGEAGGRKNVMGDPLLEGDVKKGIIPSAAASSRFIPEGSLVVLDDGDTYVVDDIGGKAVVSKKASRELVEKLDRKISKEGKKVLANAPVLDCYGGKDRQWVRALVIFLPNGRSFRSLSKFEREEIHKISFWQPYIEEMKRSLKKIQ